MKHLLIGTALTSLAAAASAAPTPGSAYGDGMVLQQGQPIVIAGTAEAGSTVTAVLGETSASARADADGAFTVTLPARPASASPATLTLTDPSGATRLENILIGDVILCSGQSNMELPVTRALDAGNQLNRRGG